MGKKTHALVLDLNYAGYGVVKSLYPYKIPIIGFYNNKSIPESKTRLCLKKYFFRNEAELLHILLNLDILKTEKPVLIFTADSYVNFFLKNRSLLEDKFLIDLPDTKTTELLLDKNQFADFAVKNNILIPKSLRLNKIEDQYNVNELIRFPAILKPFLRNPDWIQSSLPKAFFLKTYEDFKIAYAKAFNIEHNLLIQEWIPGEDYNVQYCLTYFNANSNLVASFTGYKLRQWPVGTGSTATTAPIENNWITKETKRIFQLVNYRGFGSIEFKKSDYDGQYYLMEPTAGRLNQQEYIATLNGINLPLKAYNSLTNSFIQERIPKKHPIIYIDELAEIASTITHFKRKLITFREWRKSLKGFRAYRYFNKSDISVFLGIFCFITNKIIKKIFHPK